MSVQFFLSEEGITASINGGPEKVVLRVGLTEDSTPLRSMILENEAGDPIFKYDEADGNVHYPWLVGGAGPGTNFSALGAGGFRIKATGEDLDIPLNPSAGDPADWNTGGAIAASIQAEIRAAATPGGQFENAVVLYNDGSYIIIGSLMEIATISCKETGESGEDFASLMKFLDPDYLYSMPGSSNFQGLRSGTFETIYAVYRTLSRSFFSPGRNNEKIWFVDVENGENGHWDSGSLYTPYESLQACYDRIASDGMQNDIVCVLGGHYEENIIFDLGDISGITTIGVNCDGRDVRIGKDTDPGNKSFSVIGTGNGRETYFINLRFMNNSSDAGSEAFHWNNGTPNGHIYFKGCYFENTDGELGTAHAFHYQDTGEQKDGYSFEQCTFAGPVLLHQDAAGGGELYFKFKQSDCGDAEIEIDLETGGRVEVTSDIEFGGITYNAANIAQCIPMGGIHQSHFAKGDAIIIGEDTPIAINFERLYYLEGSSSGPLVFVGRNLGIGNGRFAGEMVYLVHAGGDAIHFGASVGGMNIQDPTGEDVILDGNMLGLSWVPTGEETGFWTVMFDSKEHGTGPRLMAKVSGIDLTTPGVLSIFNTDTMKTWIKCHAILVLETAAGANGDAEVRCGITPNNNEVFDSTVLAIANQDDAWYWQLSPVIAQGGSRALVYGADRFGPGTEIQFEVVSGDTTASVLTGALYLFGEYVDAAVMPT